MVTETILKTILKNNMASITGKVRFDTVNNSNNRLIKKSKLAFFLAFEINTANNGTEFQYLYTNRNAIREFAHLHSIQKFLENLDPMMEWELEGVISKNKP